MTLWLCALCGAVSLANRLGKGEHQPLVEKDNIGQRLIVIIFARGGKKQYTNTVS